MKFKPGHDKLGGRRKGIPNRRTRHLYEALEGNGYSIVENVIKIIPKLDPAKQADVLLDLMQYLYPKRKPGIALETGEMIFDAEVAAELTPKAKGAGLKLA